MYYNLLCYSQWIELGQCEQWLGHSWEQSVVVNSGKAFSQVNRLSQVKSEKKKLSKIWNGSKRFCDQNIYLPTCKCSGSHHHQLEQAVKIQPSVTISSEEIKW